MKTRNILLFLLLFSQFSFSQQIDLCDYFSISVSQMQVKGEQKTYVSTAKNSSVDTDFGKAIKEHHLRYDYLLTRMFRNDSAFMRLFPDSIKIKKLFSQQLKGPSRFRSNFDLICPTKFLDKPTARVQFSQSEMMFVASRFFYCNKVNKDTAIVPKICVGINGIKEMNANRDLVALESFVFEAIFNLMQDSEEPKFLEDFTYSIQNSMKERKRNLTNLDDFLIQVRNDCFRDMEQNESLQKSLLVYYEKNKSTINFTIQ